MSASVKNSKRRLNGKKKLVTFTEQMEKDISQYCRDNKIESESELIRKAIADYIYNDYSDNSLKLQGLKALQNKTEELRDMIDILFKYTRLMHINLLGYNPELDEEFAEAAFKSAMTRHNKFFDAFQDSLKSDPPFFERLLHKYYTGEDNG